MARKQVSPARRARRRCAPPARHPGVQVHPSAVLDEPCRIGRGTRVWHFSHVMAGARIGRDCILGQNVFVAASARVGDGVKLENGVSIFDGVELADGVFCGPGAVFTNVRYPRATVSRRGEFARTRVGRGATIGANATILCGLSIGEYALVGAGAVVTRDVPPHAIVVGNPARIVGWACACGEKLARARPGAAASRRCARCGRRWATKKC